jgi:hypothetical protein
MRLKRKEETKHCGVPDDIWGGIVSICTRPPWQPPNSTQTLVAAWPALAVLPWPGSIQLPIIQMVVSRGLRRTENSLRQSGALLTDQQAGKVAVYHSLGSKV